MDDNFSLYTTGLYCNVACTWYRLRETHWCWWWWWWGGSKVTTLMVTTSTAMQIPQSEAMLVPLKKMHKIIYHRNLYPWPVIIYNINIEEMDDKDHLSDIRDKNGDLLRSYVKGPNKSIKTFWFYMRHRTAITGVSFRKFIVELYFWW